MRIAIASDHGGYSLKVHLAGCLRAAGHEVEDLGTHGTESVDYPDFAHAVAEAVAGGRAERGILVCGTGIGVSIAANRHPGIRAALVGDPWSARMAAEHNDAQILCLGGRVTGPDLALASVEAWLATPFAGGRHARRVQKIELPGS